jgi:hypothetical protein
VRRTAGGVTEYLWPDALSVRAIDVEGTPLTEWVSTNAQGGFTLPAQNTPQVFFLECSDALGKVHAYSQVFAPGTKTAVAAVDSSTTMMAISTVHLFNFIPPEKSRLSAIADSFQAYKDATTKAAKTLSPKSQLFKQLAAKVAAYQAGQDMLDARIAELDRSWAAFDPTNFGRDRLAADPVINQALAEANAKALETETIYNGMYDKSSSGQLQARSLLPITLVSPF